MRTTAATEVTIAILPHGPGLHEVLAEAEALNLPLRVHAGCSGDGSRRDGAPPVVSLDHPACSSAR